MIEIVNVEIAVVANGKRGRSAKQVRDHLQQAIESFKFPLGYSFKTSFMKPVTVQTDGEKHGQKNKTCDCQNKMADIS